MWQNKETCRTSPEHKGYSLPIAPIEVQEISSASTL